MISKGQIFLPAGFSPKGHHHSCVPSLGLADFSHGWEPVCLPAGACLYPDFPCSPGASFVQRLKSPLLPCGVQTGRVWVLSPASPAEPAPCEGGCTRSCVWVLLWDELSALLSPTGLSLLLFSFTWTFMERRSPGEAVSGHLCWSCFP